MARPIKKVIRKRKSRFINTQRHIASCGPIAIANAIKWLGTETSYTSVLDFCTAIRAYSPQYGMFPFQLDYALKTLKIDYSKHCKFTSRDLDRTLKKGKAVILIFDTISAGSHATFINGIDLEKKHYLVWNRWKGATPWCKRDYITQAIKRSARYPEHLYAFVLKKVRQKRPSSQS